MVDKTIKSHWQSTAFGLDIRNRKVVYAYDCITEGVDKPPEGVASFKLQWADANLSGCDRLEGFAADLSDGERDFNTEHKVSDKWLGFDAGYNKALEEFAEKPNNHIQPTPKSGAAD